MKKLAMSALIATLLPSFALAGFGKGRFRGFGEAPAPSARDGTKPADRKEWLACRENGDCASVELGCYYWQPVNKAFAAAMKEKFPTACLSSSPSGPRPASRCESRACANVLTASYWKLLTTRPEYGAIRHQLVGERLDACLRATSARLDDRWRASLIDSSVKKVDGLAVGDETLVQILETAIPCQEPVLTARALEKWRVIQGQDPSIDLRVDRVRLDYSLDDLHPPLIGYKSTMKKCLTQEAPSSPRGDMRVKFAIAADGKIEPGSFDATFMAAAHMKEFIDCLSTPFKKLEFPAPKDGKPVLVDVSYRVPFVGDK